MERCTRKKDCIYALQDAINRSGKHCGYILFTGEPRGCPLSNCDKFKSKKDNEREKQYKKPKIKKHKPFNPWITKYFDLTGNGIESRDKNER